MIRGPNLTVDAVIISDYKSIILIKRKNSPYKGSWALPGGFVEYGETLEEAVIREVKEETSLSIELKGIVGVYSDPNRDPRGHMVSVCYLSAPIRGSMKAQSDAEDVSNFPFQEALNMKLAFDHNQILEDALRIIQ